MRRYVSSYFDKKGCANKEIDYVEIGQAGRSMARRSKRCKSTRCMGSLGGTEAEQ